MVCRLMFEVTRLHVGGCVVESRRIFANRIDLGRTTFRVLGIDKQLLQASYRWSGVMCCPKMQQYLRTIGMDATATISGQWTLLR
jgi:hypothetical protein